MVGNRWCSGMADILVVDWYPIETSNNGCSRTGTHYISTGPKHFTRVRRPSPRRRRDARLADGPDPQEPEPALPQEAGPDRAAPAPPGPRRVPLPGRHGLAFHTWSNSSYHVMSAAARPRWAGCARSRTRFTPAPSSRRSRRSRAAARLPRRAGSTLRAAARAGSGARSTSCRGRGPACSRCRRCGPRTSSVRRPPDRPWPGPPCCTARTGRRRDRSAGRCGRSPWRC